jgi:outer membrane receptor protein involved in Fe transport
MCIDRPWQSRYIGQLSLPADLSTVKRLLFCCLCLAWPCAGLTDETKATGLLTDDSRTEKPSTLPVRSSTNSSNPEPKPGEAAKKSTASGAATQLAKMQVTAGLRPEAVANVAAAVSVITHDEIFARANALLPDLLRDEAGIYIQQTTPGQGIPVIRGLKGSQNLHLVDGIRLNTAFFRDAPNQYLALIDPFWADQIEVVRGPSSVLYGGDAMGGVVNVITHRPGIGLATAFSGESYFSWLSASGQLIAHNRLDYSADRHALSLAATWLNSQKRRIGGGQTIPFTAFEAKSVASKWLGQLNDQRLLGLDWQLLQQDETPRVDALIAGFGQDHADAEQYVFAPNRRNFVHLFLDDTAATGWYDSARYQLAWQKITDQRIVRKWQAAFPQRENNQSRLLSAKVIWHKAVNAHRQLTFGLDAWHDRIGSHRWQQTAGGEAPQASRFPDRSSMRQVAAFAEWKETLGNHHWIGGLRHSRYRTVLNRPQLAPRALRLHDWSGHLGWGWQYDSNHTLFANFGRGFRPPNIFDLGQLGERPGNRFNILNPDLKPESLLSLDIGWKRHGGHWNGQLAAFVTDYRDKIASVYTGEVSAGGQQIVQSQNLARVRLWGVESEMEWLGAAGQRLWGSLNYTWGAETRPEGTVPADRVPPLNAHLAFSVPLYPNWLLEFHSRMASAQRRLSPRDRRDPRIDPRGTGGYARFDLYLNWHITHSQTLRVGIENLFDKRYRQHGSGLDSAGRGVLLSWHGIF